MFPINKERRNYNAYGYLIGEAFDRASQAQPEEPALRLIYKPTDLPFLADHIDAIMYDMSNSGDVQKLRGVEAVRLRFVLHLSPEQINTPQLINDFGFVGLQLQRAHRSGQLIPGEYGVKPAQARALTDRGLRFIAQALSQTPFLDEFFPKEKDK